MRNNVTPLRDYELGTRRGEVASNRDDRPWEFPVEMLPLQAVKPLTFADAEAERISIPPEFARAVIRTDTDTCLGIHGRRYNVRPYADTVKAFETTLENSPLKLENAKISYNVVGNGERMRLSVDLPEHEFEVGRSRQVGDIVRMRLNFMDSYDGAWSTQYGLGAMRLICLNGMTRMGFTIGVKSKHTNADLPELENGYERIAAAINAFYQDRERFMAYVNRGISDAQAEDFLTQTMCLRWDKKAKTWRTNEPLKRSLMEMWYEESTSCGNNLWGLYNTLTRWATHGGIRKGSDKLNTIVNREVRVENIVQRDEWLKLAA